MKEAMRILPRSHHCFTQWLNPIFCGSHDELRAALRVAGKEIRKLKFRTGGYAGLEAAAPGAARSAGGRGCGKGETGLKRGREGGRGGP